MQNSNYSPRHSHLNHGIVIKVFSDFESHLKDLKSVPLKKFIKEVKQYGSINGSLST